MLSVTPAGTTSNLYIEARLYRDDKPGTEYRMVHLTLHVSVLTTTELTRQQCVLGTQP